MERKRLSKSYTDRVICGVCGGIAEYFNISPLIPRLIFLLTGSLGIYVILALLLPYDDIRLGNPKI